MHALTASLYLHSKVAAWSSMSVNAICWPLSVRTLMTKYSMLRLKSRASSAGLSEGLPSAEHEEVSHGCTASTIYSPHVGHKLWLQHYECNRVRTSSRLGWLSVL